MKTRSRAGTWFAFMILLAFGFLTTAKTPASAQSAIVGYYTDFTIYYYGDKTFTFPIPPGHYSRAVWTVSSSWFYESLQIGMSTPNSLSGAVQNGPSTSWNASGGQITDINNYAGSNMIVVCHVNGNPHGYCTVHQILLTLYP